MTASPRICPAAIYSLHGEDIDIIRFNQMFYSAVSVPDFHSKLLSIQKVMPENEVPLLFQTLKNAYDDRLNGAHGVFTFKKIDGSAARFLIHFYYLNEDGEQRRFYGSARDGWPKRPVDRKSKTDLHLSMQIR